LQVVSAFDKIAYSINQANGYLLLQNLQNRQFRCLLQIKEAYIIVYLLPILFLNIAARSKINPLLPNNPWRFSLLFLLG